MNVLVTGGAGFIGSHVCDELRARGHSPIVFDHYGRGECFVGDIRDATAVSEAMHHAEGFIHLAASLGTQETINDPMPAVETNVLGGINVLQAAAKYDVPGVNIAVGNHWMPNTYAITKSTIERFVAMYNKYRGTRVNNVRAMNAYGPRQVAAAPYGPSKVRKITPSFVCRALSGDPIEIYGDGSQVSDMVYVGDVAKAVVSAMYRAKEGVVFGRAVEVGPKESNTVLQVAELVRELAESQSEIVFLPMRPGENEGDVVSADTETLRMVGMSPEDLKPLRDGMAQTVDYFRGVLGRVGHVRV